MVPQLTTSIAFRSKRWRATLRRLASAHLDEYSVSRRTSNDHFWWSPSGAEKRGAPNMPQVHPSYDSALLISLISRGERPWLSIISARYYWRKYGREIFKICGLYNKRNGRLHSRSWFLSHLFLSRLPPSGLNANLTKGCSLQEFRNVEYHWRAIARTAWCYIQQSTSRLRLELRLQLQQQQPQQQQYKRWYVYLWTKIVIPRWVSYRCADPQKSFGQIERYRVEIRPLSQSIESATQVQSSISTTLSIAQWLIPLCPPSHSCCWCSNMETHFSAQQVQAELWIFAITTTIVATSEALLLRGRHYKRWYYV
jgi:hypothetical protein